MDGLQRERASPAEEWAGCRERGGETDGAPEKCSDLEVWYQAGLALEELSPGADPL